MDGFGEFEIDLIELELLAEQGFVPDSFSGDTFAFADAGAVAPSGGSQSFDLFEYEWLETFVAPIATEKSDILFTEDDDDEGCNDFGCWTTGPRTVDLGSAGVYGSTAVAQFDGDNPDVDPNAPPGDDDDPPTLDLEPDGLDPVEDGKGRFLIPPGTDGKVYDKDGKEVPPSGTTTDGWQYWDGVDVDGNGIPDPLDGGGYSLGGIYVPFPPVITPSFV